VPVLAAVALAVLALLAPLGGVGPGSGVARAMGPLPACRYDSILTTPRRYVDWPITLVDTILRVPSTYAPPDLVPITDAGLTGVGVIRSVAIDDLRAMGDAARAAGAPIAVKSAYRSYQQQQVVFQGYVREHGYNAALTFSARPGHSEHQLGLAIDFRSEAGGDPFVGDWATTAPGAWMKANAWQYGWVMSYPKGKFATVCYISEPWHYRYVGRDLAAQIHASGKTIRAYLWANYTTAVVGPPGSPTPSTRPSTPPTAPPPTSRPVPSPTASATPTPVAASPTPGVATASAGPTRPAPRTPPPAASPVAVDPAAAGFFGSPGGFALAAIGVGLFLVVAFATITGARRSGRRGSRNRT
jgi:LAS superfamily LD-carboxypeptidase LdcB